MMHADPGVAEPGSPIQAAPALMSASVMAEPRLATDKSILYSDDSVTWDRAPKPAPVQTSLMARGDALDPELTCMAKVVRHEAANQSRVGQLAVAQILMNRVRSGKFPGTVCDAVAQRGQFFDVASYNPRRDTAEWRLAVEVSREAMAGLSPDVTNGAYFYHATTHAPNGFFRTRQRVATLGDHAFYR